MNETEEARNRVRKLNSRAGTAKMELHDLTEDLPINWSGIIGVAEKTFAIFEELDAAKAELARLEAA